MVNIDELQNAMGDLETAKRAETIKFYKPFSDKDTHFHGDTCECHRDHDIYKERDSFSPDNQRDFHQSNAEIKWCMAGNRAGKTIPGAAEAIFMALGEDGEEYWGNLKEASKKRYRNVETPNEGWVVSRTYDVQVEAAQKWIMNLLPDEMIERTRLKHDDILGSIELTNGSTIRFKSTESEREAFQGAAKRWIWFDEEPKSEDIYNECTMRRSGVKPLHIFGTCTPVNGLTFLYNRVYENDKADVFIWSQYDNPYFNHEKAWEMENSLSKKDSLVRIYGQFMQRAGLIYPMFTNDKHVKEEFTIPSDWTIYEAIDPGYINQAAIVWWAVSGNDVHFIVDEVYEKGMTIPELCHRVHEKRNNPRCYEKGVYDPALTVVDPQVNETNTQTKRTDLDVMQSDNPEDGPRVLAKPASKASAGIRSVRSWLRPSTKGPRLHVLEHCYNTIYEFKNYRKRERRGSKSNKNPYEKPRKKDDHIMNCLKYMANENPMNQSQRDSVSSYESKKSEINFEKKSQNTKKKVRNDAPTRNVNNNPTF